MLVTGRYEKSSCNPILLAIRDLPFLNIETGPWVAGGAARRALLPYSDGGDIDIFFPSEETFKNASDYFLFGSETSKLLRKTPTAHTYQIHGKMLEHQAIVRRYESPEHLFNEMDYTICMIATDGHSWIADHRCIEDNEKKIIRINEGKLKTNRLLRLQKYTNYGFTPAPGVLAAHLGLPNHFWIQTRMSPHLRVSMKDEDYM